MVEGENKKDRQKDRIVTILGPTATGKTRRAVDLARHISGEIISADSRQVYRGMDIGTGKDLNEYEEVPYHLIDICDAGEKYNLYRYVKDFHRVYDEIRKRDNTPILCGGTGMYLETILSGVRLPEVPENKQLREELKSLTLKELTDILTKYKSLHNSTDVDTEKRAIRAIEIAEYYVSHPEEAKLANKSESKPLESIIIGIDIPREERRLRITRRLKQRLDEGMVQEIERLLREGVIPENLLYYGLEYKFVTLYILGKLSYNQMVEELEIAIHQFAKRQMTWFRGMEKRGFKINWLSYDLGTEEFVDKVMNLMNQ